MSTRIHGLILVNPVPIVSLLAGTRVDLRTRALLELMTDASVVSSGWKRVMFRPIPIVVIFYVAFVTACFVFARNHIRYSDVENWPSVEANDVKERGSVSQGITNTRTGTRLTTSDTRTVSFRYEVNGEKYKGTKASPNGGGLPFRFGENEWRAYYHPEKPQLAVLIPVPYAGVVWIVIALFSGMVVLVHAVFHFWDPH